MNQYCKTKRKTIVLQMDISGKTNQKQLHALYADRDNENDLENLGEDSDTEFIPVTEEVREALITLDNNIEVEGTASITGDVQRPSLDMENLEAVVHDTIAELSPVSSPTSSRISNRDIFAIPRYTRCTFCFNFTAPLSVNFIKANSTYNPE